MQARQETTSWTSQVKSTLRWLGDSTAYQKETCFVSRKVIFCSRKVPAKLLQTVGGAWSEFFTLLFQKFALNCNFTPPKQPWFPQIWSMLFYPPPYNAVIFMMIFSLSYNTC